MIPSGVEIFIGLLAILKLPSRLRPAFANAASNRPSSCLVVSGLQPKPYQPAPKRTARWKAASVIIGAGSSTG